MAIATLTGDNGVLTKAGNAKNTSTEAEVLEKLKLAYEDYYLGQHTNPGYTFQNAVDKMFGTGVATVTESNGIYTVSFLNGKKYTFNALTGVAQEKQPDTLSIITKDNYGDYIDLGQDVVKTSATTDDWRILYNDTTNNVVYAILADYLPNNNAAVIASGLSIVVGKTYNVKFQSSGTRDALCNSLNNTTAWQSLIQEKLRSTCQVKGAATAEIIMASYNEKYNTNLNYTSIPCLRTDPNDDSSSIDTIYIPHPCDGDYNGCYGYRLATPYDSDNTNVYRVLNNGYVSFDGYFSNLLAVCPVVSLPSNIQVTNNNGIWSIEQ